MRILTNIVNEFQQYREKLSKTGQPLNMTKLLAMIVYKNYYPKDFAELHRRKGKVYACISQKKAFIEIATKEINDSIAVCNKEIQAYKEAKKWEIVELKKLFLVSLLNQVNSTAVSIRISNQYYTIESIATSDNLFNDLLTQESVSYHYLYNYNSGSASTTSTRINVKSVYQESPYFAKIQLISIEPETLKNRLNNLNKDLRTTSGLKLASILLKYPKVMASDLYMNLGLSEMMNIFLIEGYIDTIIRKAQYPVTQNNESLSNIVLSIFSENLDGISYTIAELRSLIKQSSLLVPKKIIANHVLIALDYNENEFIDVLQSIGDPSFTAISERHKKPKIDKTVPNLELLKTLKNKGFISSAKDEGEYMRPNYFKS